jgi:hypothetical protein
LDGRKYDRDIARKGVEIAQTKQKVAEAEMRLLQMDARVGLSRRSRNSPEASSVRSEGQSTVSSSHMSRRRHSPRELNKEESLGSQVEEVISTVSERAIVPLDDSHGTMLYYLPRESSSRSSTAAGDASSAAADVAHDKVAYETPQDNSTATVADVAVVQTPDVQTPVVRAPVVQTPVVQTPVVQALVVHTPVANTPVAQTSVYAIVGDASGVQDSAGVPPDDNDVATYKNNAPIAAYNNNTPIATYENDTPITTYKNDTPIVNYKNNTPIDTYKNNAPITTYKNNTPIAHYNDAIVGTHMEFKTLLTCLLMTTFLCPIMLA